MSGLTLLGGMMATMGSLPNTILSVDFTLLADGGHSAASFLSATGLTFIRDTVSTVQTSSAVLDTTPGVNYACIGSIDGAKRGLINQPGVRNQLGVGSVSNSMPRSWATLWSAGSAFTPTTGQSSPDGTSNATQMVVSSNGYAPYYSFGGLPLTGSCWQQGIDKSCIRANAVNVAGVVNAGTGTSNWERLDVSSSATQSVFSVVDCRDWSSVSPGTAPTARTVIIDLAQLEYGLYSTECIVLGDFSRTPDRLSYDTGSDLLTDTGQFKFRVELYPKHNSSDQVYATGDGGALTTLSGWWLLSWNSDGNNYAKINDSDKKLSVRIAGGTIYTSTNAVSFSKHDLVEFYIAIGNNIASVAKYRVNGGSWTDLVLATVPDAITIGATPLSILQNDVGSTTIDRGNFLSRIKKVSFLTGTAADPTL